MQSPVNYLFNITKLKTIYTIQYITHTQTIAKINYRFLTPVVKAMKSLNINYWANAYAFARFTLGPIKWASVPCPTMVNFVRMRA